MANPHDPTSPSPVTLERPARGRRPTPAARSARVAATCALLAAAACQPKTTVPGSRPATGTSDEAIPADLAVMSPGAPAAAGPNVLWNGSFDEGTRLPWAVVIESPARGDFALEGGELCLDVASAGSASYNVLMRHQAVSMVAGHEYTVALKAHATAPTRLWARIQKGGSHYFSQLVDVGTEPQTYSATFRMDGVSDDKAELVLAFGGKLAASGAPVKICLDDIRVEDPKLEPPLARTRGPFPAVRVSQVGYLPALAKVATYKSPSTAPQGWSLVDASGAELAKGMTTVHGEDLDAGEHVHVIDFSTFTAQGDGLVVRVGADQSPPFAVRPDIYRQLRSDALWFFYHQRSGVEIAMPWAGEARWARPAGHVSDKKVACLPGTCSYTLDLSGGWYDAGDHGKYVVNGGISLGTMLGQYERAVHVGKSAAAVADGTLRLPESKNGVPDILDEARFEMEWMLRMQVPAGQELAGMAHHKMHSESWTPIPTRPDKDTVTRYVHPPTTTATLNLAATAAQAARIWKTIDPKFSAKCLEAARAAYAAAQKNPKLQAKTGQIEGGGAYGDPFADDEFFWAATELAITTADPAYVADMKKSKHFEKFQVGITSMSWDHMAALGTISLAVVPHSLGEDVTAKARQQIVKAADKYVSDMMATGYRAPLQSGKYPWGSNSFILNNLMIMALAADFSGDRKYADAVAIGMGYVLGRNPLSESYVTGYGTNPVKNPHHRFWAQQKNPDFPPAPPGIVSGGPNSSLEDPFAQAAGLLGCAPQQCHIDHFESWSTNEITINWNAPLAWVTAWLDDRSRAAR